MHSQRARVLLVDNSERTTSLALEGALVCHDVEVVGGAFDAIYMIDCAGRPHDVIFCDLASADLSGPELWAYLSLGRARAAARMVFVASTPLSPETRALLDRIPNPCVDLPADAEALDALVSRRAAGSGSVLARMRTRAGDERPSATAEAGAGA